MHRYISSIKIRKDIIRKDGTSPIYLIIHINKRRKRIPLGIYAEVRYWHAGSASVKIPRMSKLSEDTNARLHKIKEKVARIFTEAHLKDTPLNMERFLHLYEKAYMQEDFLWWMAQKIVERKSVIKGSTIIQYRKLMKFLISWRDAPAFHEFSDEEVKMFGDHLEGRAIFPLENYSSAKQKKLKAFVKGAKALTFSELNDGFVDRFEVHLRRQGYGVNTRGSYHKILRNFINLAIRGGRMDDDNPYKRFKIIQAKSNRVYLTPEEVTKLWELYQEKTLDTHLQRVLRWFLFMCFTGLRPSDLVELEERNVIHDKLVFCPNKTEGHKLFLSIPLSRYAVQLIKDGEGKGLQLFRCILANNINPPLKIIADITEINKHLTNYVGRHTFATTFLSAGGKVTVLQTLLGHSKIDTTMVYVHILEKDKVEQMRIFDEFWNFEKPKVISAIK